MRKASRLQIHRIITPSCEKKKQHMNGHTKLHKLENDMNFKPEGMHGRIQQ